MPTKAEVDAYAANLFKHNPSELRRYHQLTKQETTTVTKAKKLPKYIRDQLKARSSRVVAAKSVQNVAAYEADALQRLTMLEKQLAKSQGQDAWGLAFQIHRERSKLGALTLAKAGIPPMDSFDRTNAYLADPNQPARDEARNSRAATGGAIAGVQGNSIDHMGPFFGQGRRHVGPRETLSSILDDSGRSETLETSEIQTRKLEKQLADARTPSERESLGYQVTRRRLLAGHYRGEI